MITEIRDDHGRGLMPLSGFSEGRAVAVWISRPGSILRLIPGRNFALNAGRRFPIARQRQSLNLPHGVSGGFRKVLPLSPLPASPHSLPGFRSLPWRAPCTSASQPTVSLPLRPKAIVGGWAI